VLDEAYSEIPGDEDAKDKKIRHAHSELSQAYANLTVDGCLDYSDPCRRFAYIYKYTTSHANMVSYVIKRSAPLRALFQEEKVAISCIGGGPGSDFLGILKYCMNEEITPELKCRIFDRDPAWAESWDDVDDKIGLPFRISTSFQSLDVTDSSSWKPFKKYFGSDLFTLIYFMSEVYAKRTEAEPYFLEMMSRAKAGALILYIDNSSPQFHEWFEKLADESGFKIILSDAELYTLPFEEEKKDLQPYYDKFEDPKIQSKVAYRVAVKA
jgi:hypothetical protein